MDDFVALVVGVASYPQLPADWDIIENRTANDAIAVATALRRRGVPREKIKLLLSGKNLPTIVEDVPVEPATSSILSKFIIEELGEPPFVGKRFLVFWSGHGVEARENSEPLVIMADSLRKADGRRLFRCLGINRFRTQLQGMPFMQQLLCINACRTPAEWSITANDERPDIIRTLERSVRSAEPRQARFFATRELMPVPVKSGPEGLSNEFVAAICDCITNREWPPRETEWLHRLRAAWPDIWSEGAQEVDAAAFKLLNNNIRVIDRSDQLTLVDGALKRVVKWKQQPRAMADLDEQTALETTLIDLHACAADRLDLLMTRLEEEVFKPKLVPEGVQRANRWPDRAISFEKRKQGLFEEVTLRLSGYRRLTVEQIVNEIPGEPYVRVVFIEIDGPCTPDEDGQLVLDLRKFWHEMIREVKKRGSGGPCLPLLLIGHIDPELGRGAARPHDATRFYHNAGLDAANEHRLNPIRGEHLRKWLNGVVPAERFAGRGELERVLAAALGGRTLIEEVEVRMGQVVDFIQSNTPPPTLDRTRL
jgi:hypothetical protein